MAAESGAAIPESLFVESSLEAPGILVGVDDDVVAFPSQRAIAFASDAMTEMLPIDAPGAITAMAVSYATKIIAIAAKSENPAVVLVNLADKSVRGTLNGAASLEVDAVALSQDGTRALTFSPDEGFGAVGWDTTTGAMLPGAATHLPASPTTAASFHPRDRSLACAITPAGIFFWHFVEAGNGSYQLHVLPGVLPDESSDRLALASTALAALRSHPHPLPMTDSDPVPAPATGVLSPEALAMHGIAAAIDVAVAAADPASAAGLVPGADVVPLIMEEAGAGAGPAATAGGGSMAALATMGAGGATKHGGADRGGAAAVLTADGGKDAAVPGESPAAASAAMVAAAAAPAQAAGKAGKAGSPAEYGSSNSATGRAAAAAATPLTPAKGIASPSGAIPPGLHSMQQQMQQQMPWDDDEAQATGAAVSWSHVLMTGAVSSWLARRRFTCHAWLPDGRVVAGIALGWLLAFDPLTGKCSGAVPPPAPGVRPSSLLVLAEGLLVGRSDGRVEMRAFPALEVTGSVALLSPCPHPVAPGSRSLASSAGAVLALAPSPSFTVAFASTSGGGIFRIDLCPPGDGDDDTEAQAAARAAAPGSAASGLPAHGDMASCVLGVARSVRGPRSGSVLALRPLVTPPDAAASASLVAAIDAAGAVTAYDTSFPSGVRVAARRLLFEPAGVAASTDARPQTPPWAEEGASGASFPPGASRPSTTAGFTARDSGGAGPSLGAQLTALGSAAGPRGELTGVPVAASCLDSHQSLPLLVAGTPSGCVHLLWASANGSGSGSGSGSGESATLAPVGAGAAAPGLLLTAVALTRVHAGDVSALAICPGLPLLAAVSQSERRVAFLLLHVPETAPSIVLDRVALDGPATLLPVGAASLPPAFVPGAGAPAAGSAPVCACTWRVDPASGSAELLIALADGSIVSVPAPVAALDAASAAMDAAGESRSGMSAALAADMVGAGWPVDASADVVVHTLAAGASPLGAVVSLTASPSGTGPLVVATPSRLVPVVLRTPWAVGKASGTAPAPASVAPTSSTASLPQQPVFGVAADLVLDEAAFPAAATPTPEAGLLGLAAAMTSTGWALAVLTAAGSAAVSFLAPESGASLAAAGGLSTPSSGRVAVTAPCVATCVALAPCGTRLVVGSVDGSVAVASLADTRLAAHRPARRPASATDAVLGARLQLLAEAVGAASSVGGRAVAAPGPYEAGAGASSSVGGIGEQAVWPMGVGVAVASDGSDPVDAVGWDDELRHSTGQAALRESRTATRSRAGELSDDGFESKEDGDDDGAARPGQMFATLHSTLSAGAMSGSEGAPRARLDAAAATCSEWVASVVEARAEAAAEPFRDTLREKLAALAHKVAELVEANAEAPELERLGREEFAVDEEGDAAAEAETARLVALRRGSIEGAIAQASEEAADIRRECVDTIEAPVQTVRAMGDPSSLVRSMAVRVLQDHEAKLMGKLALLRRMEQAEMAESAEDAVEAVGATDDLAWPGLASDLPPDADWMVNAGLLPAALDPVQQDEGLARARAERQTAAVAAAGASSPKAADGTGDEEAKDAAADASAEEGAEDGEGGEVDDFLGRVNGWEGERIAKLLYHPLACRTPLQRRAQIRFLEQLGREIAKAFNQRFAVLRKAKAEEVDRIRVRNKRMLEITRVLGREEELYALQDHDDEHPERLLTVTEAEVGFPPWEDPEEAARKEAAARAKAEADALNRDDSPERALDDMMSGTLEEKDDVQRAEDTIRATRQPWMGDAEALLLARGGVLEAQAPAVLEALLQVAMGEAPTGVAADVLQQANEALDNEEGVVTLPEEQQTAWKRYRALFGDVVRLREERRLRLEEELAGLKEEVRAIVAEFDARVGVAKGHYRTFRAAILTQEAYAHRLAAAVAGSDANLEREQYVLERLAAFSGEADKEAAALPAAEQALQAARQRLEEARTDDAEAERVFREAVRERSELGIDADLMRKLQDVFLRARHDTAGHVVALAAAMRGRDPRPGAEAVAQTHTGELAGMPEPPPAAAAAALHGARGPATAHNPAPDVPTGPSPTVAALVSDLLARAEAPPSGDMVPDELTDAAVVEEDVWAETLTRRQRKVRLEVEVTRCELEVARAAAMVASVRASLARAQGKVQALEEERNALLRANALAANDVDVMVRLNQGQDEVAGLAAIPDYGDAVLVPTRVLENENRRIQRAGRRAARREEAVRDARKDLRYRLWMREYSEGKLKDREEWLRDVSLLRVTKELQQFVSGADLAQRQKELMVRTEAQGRYLRGAHARNLVKHSRQLKRIERQVAGRRAENERLLAQLAELDQSVAVRSGIVEARERGAGGGLGPAARAQKRMTTLVTRSKLIATAKSQAEELEALRADLSRLRRRTFPMFSAGGSTM